MAELGSTTAVLNAPQLFAEFGVAGIGVILFCETGLLVGRRIEALSQKSLRNGA